jgi:hypothetical protein
MRHLRLAFTVLTFCVAALGSVMIGWIYASPNPRNAGLPITKKGEARDIRRRFSLDMDEAKQYRSADTVPDLVPMAGSLGASAMIGTEEINGFPTISRDAIERASGGFDRVGPVPTSTLPEVDVSLGQGEDGLSIPNLP